MYNKLFIAIIGMTIIFACKNGQPKQADAPATAAVDTPKIHTHKLVQKWETDTILKVPESAIFDAKNKVIYVANITGKEPWGADGKGSIGKVGLDGKIINVDWVTGLHAPKGMGIYNDKLYVADIQEIAVIDIASGKIEGKIKIFGCKGLNDISIDPSGIIYVTDSQGKRLYKVESGNSTMMLLDSLDGPNGVLVSGKNLLLLNNGGLYKVIQGNKYSISLIADGMQGGTDGVEHVKDEDYLISCWAGAVWYLNGDGRKELLYDGKSINKNTADIGFDPSTKTVYVPTFWKNSLMAFELVEN